MDKQKNLLVHFLIYIAQLMRIILIALVLISIANISKAQYTLEDSLLAERYYRIGDSSYMNIDTCFFYTKKALPYLMKVGLWDKYINSLNGITYCYKESSDLEKFKENVYFTLDETKRVPCSEIAKIPSLINYAVYLFEVEGNHKKASKVFLENIQSMNFKNPIFEAKVYNNFASMLRSSGDFSSALPYLERTLNIYQKNDALDIEIYKTTYNIADCYMEEKKYSQAEKYYMVAKAKLDNSVNKTYTKQYHTGIHLALSKLKYKQGEYETALSFLNKIKETGLDSSSLSSLLQLKGDIYLEQGKYDLSEEYLLKSLSYITNNNFISKAYIQERLGVLYWKKKEEKKSLLYLNSGIWTLVKNPSLDIEKNNLPSRNSVLFSEKRMFALLELKAEILASKNTQEYLELALEVYDYAFFIKQKRQEQIFDEGSKIFQNKEMSNLQEEAMDVLWKLYQKTNKSEYAERAFSFIELGKSQVLLEEIKRRETEGFSNVNDTLISRRYYLLGKLKDVQRKIKKSAKEEKDKLQEKYVELQNEITILSEKIKKENPIHIFSENKNTSIDNIRKNILGDHTALVEYFMKDTFVYTLYVDKSEINFSKISEKNMSENINSLLALKKYSSKSEKKEYKETAKVLYQTLLDSIIVSKKINHLIIIPDKKISYLPFEMLLLKDDKFLIEEYAVSYAYSATILNNTKRNNDKMVAKGLLSFAPVFDNDENKINLSLSEEEIKGVQVFFESDTFIRKKATKDSFIRNAPNYKYIHLSTHAYATNNDEPFIMFYNDTLFLGELYSQRFNANMVVLSACETALGKEEEGEGLMSLSRGFTYAGVPSQITSLWSINEFASKEIVVDFYKNLSEGMDKANALRQAKLSYLGKNTGSKIAPYYWAGLIQLGDFGAVLETKNKFSSYLIIGGTLLLLFFLFFIMKNKVSEL